MEHHNRRMTMKPIFLSLILLFPSALFSAEPETIRDGKIVFAKYTLFGEGIFSDEEKQKIIESQVDTGTGTIVSGDFVPYVPPGWKVNLSTCTTFESATDWKTFQTKKGLKKAIIKLRIELDSMQDLSPAERADVR